MIISNIMMGSSIKQGDDHCSSSLSSQFSSPSPRWMDLSERLQERSFQGVFVSKVNRSSNARDHPDVANLHNWWWQSGHQYPLLLGSMYIWTLLNQLNRSFNYNGENSSHRNFNFQTKKDIGYPLVPKFSSFRGLSSTLSWKCPHITLSPPFGLFQSERWQKRVF